MHSDALPCPSCGQSTDSLKAYRLPTFLLFIWVGASFKHGLVVGCPPCVRKELGKLTLINILPANLLWLILLVPWYGIAALRSFTLGHSSAARALALAPPPEEQYRSASGANAFASLASGSTGNDWDAEPSLRGYFSPERPGEINAHFLLLHRGTVEELPVKMLRREGSCYRARLLRASANEPGLYETLEVFVRPSMSHPPLLWVPPAAAQNLEGWSARCQACQFDLCLTPVLELARRTHPAAQPGYEPSPLTDVCGACGGVLNVTRSLSPSFAAPVPAKPEDYPAGLGEIANKIWLVAFGAVSFLSLVVVGVAGYGSESAGVSAAYMASFFVGAALGGWRGLHWARSHQKGAWWTGLWAALCGVFLFAAAVFFFEGIFPSL